MARNFNGTTDTLIVDPVPQNTGAFTVACWINPTSVTPATGFKLAGYRDRNNFGIDDKELGLTSAGRLSFYVFVGSAVEVVGTTTLTAGVWRHVAAIHDPGASTNRITVWLDGAQDGTDNTAGTSYGGFTNPILEVAGSGVGGHYPNFFGGGVTDLRVWNIALTGAELASAMAGHVVHPEALIAWLEMPGFFSPEPDLSGNGRVGVVTGTTRIVDPAGLTRRQPYAVASGAEGSASSGNVTLGAPAASGGNVNDDLWIAAIHSNDQVAHSFSANWTQLFQANGGGTTSRLSAWYFRYAGSNPTLVATHTAGSLIIGGIVAVRNCLATGSPVNTTGSGGAGTDTTIELAGITPTVANTLLLAIDGVADGNTRGPLATGFYAALTEAGPTNAYLVAGTPTTATRDPTGDNAADTITGTWSGTASSRFTLVDDYPDTTGTDFLNVAGAGADQHLTFTYTAFAIPAGSTGISVQVLYYDRKNASQACQIGARLWIGSTPTAHNATTHNPVQTTFTTRTDDFGANNPKSGVAWTVNDINGVGTNGLVGFGFFSSDSSPTIDVSSIRLQVTYSSGGGSVATAFRFWPSGATGGLVNTQAGADPWASVLLALTPVGAIAGGPPVTLSVGPESLSAIDGGAAAERYIEVWTGQVVIQSAGAAGTLSPSVADALTLVDSGALARFTPLIFTASESLTASDAGASAQLSRLLVSAQDVLTAIDGGATALRVQTLSPSVSDALTAVDAGATLLRVNALASTLTDDFTGAMNTAKWEIAATAENPSTDPLVTVTQTGGQVVIQPRSGQPAGTTAYNGYRSLGFYRLTDSSIAVEVVQVSTGSPDIIGTTLAAAIDVNNQYTIIGGGGVLVFADEVAGSANFSNTLPYNASVHRWWRLRHVSADNTLYYETSTDGFTWTIQRPLLGPTLDLSAMRVGIEAGTYDTTTTLTPAIFDRFNIAGTPTNIRLITVSDALTAADGGATAELSHAILDTFLVVDAGATVVLVSAIVTRFINLSSTPEILTLGDISLQANLTPLQVSASDSLIGIDAGATVQRVQGVTITASDNLTLVDAGVTVQARPVLATVQDSLTLIDAGASAQLSRLLIAAQELLTVVDAGATAGFVAAIRPLATDNLTVVDAALTIRLTHEILDNFMVVDAGATVTLVSAVGTRLINLSSTPESVVTSDTLLALNLTPLFVTASDVATVADSGAVAQLKTLVLQAADVLTTADAGVTAQLLQVLRPSATDALTVIDAGTLFFLPKLVFSVQEITTVIDAGANARLARLLIQVIDSLTVVDAAPSFRFSRLLMQVSDTLTLAESVLVHLGAPVIGVPTLRATAEVRDLTKTIEITLASVTAEVRILGHEVVTRQTVTAEVRDLLKTLEIATASVTAEVRNLAKTA